MNVGDLVIVTYSPYITVKKDDIGRINGFSVDSRGEMIMIEVKFKNKMKLNFTRRDIRLLAQDEIFFLELIG